MNISLNWLKYYVDIDVPVQELCDKMVMAGFEVEGAACRPFSNHEKCGLPVKL